MVKNQNDDKTNGSSTKHDQNDQTLTNEYVSVMVIDESIQSEIANYACVVKRFKLFQALLIGVAALCIIGCIYLKNDEYSNGAAIQRQFLMIWQDQSLPSNFTETPVDPRSTSYFKTLISMIDQLDPSNRPPAQKKQKSSTIDANKTKEEFRNYDDNPRKAEVEAFYKQQHEKTTYDFVLKQRANYLKFDKCVMTMYVYLHHHAHNDTITQTQMGYASLFGQYCR